MKKYGALRIVLAAALLSTFPGVAFAGETVKIGAVFAVTGPASFLGDPQKKTIEMLVEEVNAKGGIDGKKLEAVIYDSEGDPTKAVQAMGKLVAKDDVVAVLGPTTTPDTLAVVPAAEKANIPLISCAAGVAITEPIKKWVFKTAQTDALAASTIFDHMKKNGISTIGILTVADAFGESGKKQIEALAPKAGIKIVAAESFGAKDTDMTAQLTRIKTSNPQAIVCWGTNPGPAVVAKNVKDLGIKIPLFQSHGVASPKFLDLAGANADGIILPAGKILVADSLADSDNSKKILQSYLNAFSAKYQGKTSSFGGYSYDAFMMLVKAMEGTGFDKAKIRDNLEKIQGYSGISGTFNMSATDHNGLGPDAFVMVRIANGKWELIK